jgi:hypothetical protein
MSMIDSPYVIQNNVVPAPGSYIVLWDGFNSYVELLRARADLANRNDLTFAYVGTFSEITAALPERSVRLFPDCGTFHKKALDAPLRFKAAMKLKTSLRRLKNYACASERHRQLSSGGNLVFCGLLRPTEQVIANILTNEKLLLLKSGFEKLRTHHWQTDPRTIDTLVRAMYLQCQQFKCSSAEEYSGVYSVLNVCSRLFVINALHARGIKLFVNEFGFQDNFDPYDVHAYGNNVYLDFGSSRGACYWYPRTMDMQATSKRFIALRMIEEQQSLRSHLNTHTDIDYVDQLNSYVAKAAQMVTPAERAV